MLRHHRAHKTALLGFLGARPKEAGDAFRTNPRHKSTTRARVSWQDEAKPREVAGRLLNICRAGAALRTAAPPPVGATVLVRLLGAEPTPWVEATVLAADPAEAGRYRVRVKFRELCPNVFLKAAIFDKVPPPSPEPPPTGPDPSR